MGDDGGGWVVAMVGVGNKERAGEGEGRWLRATLPRWCLVSGRFVRRKAAAWSRKSPVSQSVYAPVPGPGPALRPVCALPAGARPPLWVEALPPPPAVCRRPPVCAALDGGGPCPRGEETAIGTTASPREYMKIASEDEAQAVFASISHQQLPIQPENPI